MFACLSSLSIDKASGLADDVCLECSINCSRALLIILVDPKPIY